MASKGKSAAVIETAAELGGGVALTGGSAGEAVADLFADMDQELDAIGGAIRPPARRGPGRPVGSVDRATTKMRQFLVARGYRDPLEFLGAIVSSDPRQLAADLAGHGDISRVTFDQAMEAAKLQVRAAEGGMPYWHRKQPLDVHHTGTAARPLIMMMDGPGMAAMRGMDGAMSVHDAVDYQGVSDATADPSYGDGRTDDKT